MNKRLKRDIVIPAGTIFNEAASVTERAGTGHISHIIGLTKDSFGDLTYYVDPDDKALDDWFDDADNAEVVNLPGATNMDVTTDKVLDGAKGKLKRVLVLGEEKEGNVFWFASSTSKKKHCLWIAANFLYQLFSGFKSSDWKDAK